MRVGPCFWEASASRLCSRARRAVAIGLAAAADDDAPLKKAAAPCSLAPLKRLDSAFGLLLHLVLGGSPLLLENFRLLFSPPLCFSTRAADRRGDRRRARRRRPFPPALPAYSHTAVGSAKS